jgi:hypothetical protein
MESSPSDAALLAAAVQAPATAMGRAASEVG